MLTRLLALLLASVPTFASSCNTPLQPCGNLKPNLAIFIGRERSISPGRHRSNIVTYEVQEWLWNGNGARTVTVTFYDGQSLHPAPQFVAAFLGPDGAYSVMDCGAGFSLPADDEQARRFRHEILRRAEANLRVFPQSQYKPLYDAGIEFIGARGVYTSPRDLGDLLRSWHSLFDRLPSLDRTLTLPPGDYTLASTNPRYQIKPANSKTNIPPGSCADLRIDLLAPYTLTGRLLDVSGHPIASVRIFLSGEARSGRRNHPAYYDTTTNAQRHFRFDSILPGSYYLRSEPRLFYPGVPHWSQATQIVIEEDRPAKPIEFRLPAHYTPSPSPY